MPTWERSARFDRDWEQLSAEERQRFRRVVRHFIADLQAEGFRPGLRVKRVQGTGRILEMTWAPDGRATFEYGPATPAGAHVIWRRIGRHEVMRCP